MSRRRSGLLARQIAGMTAIIAVVALVTSLVNAALLVRTAVRASRDSAELLGHSIYHRATEIIRQHDRDEIEQALADDPALRSFADAAIGYSPDTLSIAIVDTAGVPIFHSDPGPADDEPDDAIDFDAFAELGLFGQTRRLLFETDVLALELPFSIDGTTPYGAVRVTVSSALMRSRLAGPLARNVAVGTGAVLLAVLVSTIGAWRTLAPVERLRRRLAGIDVGGDAPPLDLATEADADRIADFFEQVGRRLAGPHREEGEDDGWLATVLSGLDDGVIIVGRDRRIVSISRQAEPLTDASGSAAGLALDDALPEGHALRAVVDAALERGSAGPETIADENTGAAFVVTAQRLRRHDGEAGVMVRIRDAGRVDRVLTQLTYSQKLTALGRLTAGVAHEVKNPLNAIAMHVALLRRRLADQAEAVESLEAMESDLHRLDRVVESFLHFTRPDEVRFEAVDLPGLVRDVARSIGPRAEGGGVRIETDLEDGVPTLIGSADLLRQALMNLAVNACDAMPDGGILTLGLRHDPRAGAVVVRVADDGVGIPQDRLDKVFDLFHTTKGRGSGVGLSMVYRIAELHGGSVSVESEEGRGTTFTLTVPELSR